MKCASLLPLMAAMLFGLGCGSKGGDLSVAQLSEVVAREQDSLTPCYQAGLDATPYEHEFRLQATLEIKPDGKVSKVQLDQNGLRNVGPCVEKTIRAWQFPTAKAETRASLPIIFRPKVVKTLPDGMQLPPGFKVLQDDSQ
jgi:hypothetical protein